MFKWISFLSGVPEKEIKVGSDGCTAPVYYQTLREMALEWARFSAPEKLNALSNPNNLDLEGGKRAMKQVVHDYWAHPEIIGGINRLDSIINVIGKGRFFGKGGGEALMMIGVVDKGIGIAVKVQDGDPLMRALSTTVFEVLYQLNLISKDELEKIAAMKRYYKPDLSKLPGGKFQTVDSVMKLKIH